MNRYNHIQQALLTLTASKLRSFLAILGVLVGTASVVALINCGQLATEKALAQFKTLGTDLLAVSVFQRVDDGTLGGDDFISLNTWRQLPSLIPAIKQIAPYGTAYQSISFQGVVIPGAIIAADETLASIIHVELAGGRFVSHLESFERVCVIGQGLAQKLQAIQFGLSIGKQLQIGSVVYTIIGIAKPWKENGFFNEDINQSVIIPIAGMAQVSKDTKISNAVILLKPNSDIDTIIEQINHRINTQAPKLNTFVRSAKQIIQSMENQGKIFTLLLGVIGSISLLVGGIGIMNVMLVSVNERKKEIGIRKAIGATNRDIQALFLVESVLLSFIGGLLGVIIGCIVTWIIAYFSHWPFMLYALPPLAGFAVSVITGVFFGFYPARRAAKLEPIVSLRSE